MTSYLSYADSDLAIGYRCDKEPKPENFRMHTHAEYEFYYFISGKGVYKIEGSRYPLESGDILIMAPTESHYVDLSPDYPYTRLTVHFLPGLFSMIDQTGELLRPFTQRENGSFNLYRAGDFATDAYKIFIKNLMTDTGNPRLQTISNLLPLLNEIAVAFRTKLTDEVNDSLDHRIVRFINRNLSENLTLDRICREFYISKPQLCRMFKAATGSTVWDYITEKRLVNARGQLQAGVPPTKVYEEWGFHDYSVFYRAFRKRYGVSPGEVLP